MRVTIGNSLESVHVSYTTSSEFPFRQMHRVIFCTKVSYANGCRTDKQGMCSANSYLVEELLAKLHSDALLLAAFNDLSALCPADGVQLVHGKPFFDFAKGSPDTGMVFNKLMSSISAMEMPAVFA